LVQQRRKTGFAQKPEQALLEPAAPGGRAEGTEKKKINGFISDKGGKKKPSRGLKNIPTSRVAAIQPWADLEGDFLKGGIKDPWSNRKRPEKKGRRHESLPVQNLTVLVAELEGK